MDEPLVIDVGGEDAILLETQERDDYWNVRPSTPDMMHFSGLERSIPDIWEMTKDIDSLE